MVKFPEERTVLNLQKYIKEYCKEKGWDKNSELDLMLLLTEEVGELAKAIRYMKGMYKEEARADKQGELEEELADVFSYLLDIANYYDIDLAEALSKKQASNEKREWN